MNRFGYIFQETLLTSIICVPVYPSIYSKGNIPSNERTILDQFKKSTVRQTVLHLPV